MAIATNAEGEQARYDGGGDETIRLTSSEVEVDESEVLRTVRYATRLAGKSVRRRR